MMFGHCGSICRLTLLRGSTMVAVVSLVLAGMYAAKSTTSAAPTHPLVDGRVAGGSLVIAGGGYVTPEIRQRFVELAGGPAARIVVIPATNPPHDEEWKWSAPWQAIGVSSVEVCNARDRTMANTAEFCAALKRATGVWFSGGYQNFLADRYVDTAVQTCLHDVLGRRGVVGGCSAGAAILSRVMIQEGEDAPIEAKGLDLISDAIIDQHFLQRNRLWRLQQILETRPKLVGLGIDENTALVVEVARWRLNVVGESYAMVCLPPKGAHPSRIEVLKSGDNVLLSELRKDHLAYHVPVPVEAPITQVAHLNGA